MLRSGLICFAVCVYCVNTQEDIISNGRASTKFHLPRTLTGAKPVPTVQRLSNPKEDSDNRDLINGSTASPDQVHDGSQSIRFKRAPILPIGHLSSLRTRAITRLLPPRLPPVLPRVPPVLPRVPPVLPLVPPVLPRVPPVLPRVPPVLPRVPPILPIIPPVLPIIPPVLPVASASRLLLHSQLSPSRILSPWLSDSTA
ncbi:BUB3-interacting and GLEBS motif-containing protein ZNF207-like [Fopius arisanus]|uniref:BUB3-interacting and GLEBS motif-containing protein ZNF207-like n=1 Tax=Fopius arisanus TaxID=64838 RepID=A0A9R1U451_9HYME|nr:PREDICTED: BUB3-interacting and GLEBS motif-containing protein ZNF207-like [Fopius arisanus]